MKKLKVVAFIALFVILILNISCISAIAVDYDPITNPNIYNPGGAGDATLNEKIGKLLGFIQIVGLCVSVVVLIILGLKYMLGSVEEKAINKKAMIPYLVGAVMVFSVTTIPNFIFILTDDMLNECNHMAYRTYSSKTATKHTWKIDDCPYCGESVDESGEDNHTWSYDGVFHKCTVCGYNGRHDDCYSDPNTIAFAQLPKDDPDYATKHLRVRNCYCGYVINNNMRRSHNILDVNKSYEKKEGNLHRVTAMCTDCGVISYTEPHNPSEIHYDDIENNDIHMVNALCVDCDDWVSYYEAHDDIYEVYEPFDENEHKVIKKCRSCEGTISVEYKSHEIITGHRERVYIDEEYHYVTGECRCGKTIQVKERHIPDEANPENPCKFCAP